MASLDINIVIVAIPTIGKHLHGTSLFDLLWVLLGYQVVVGCLLINFGRLADMFGRVKLYNLGFIIFTVGSALCSLSQNGAELVFFRMVQGVGGAFLISNSAAILVDTFPMNERGKALGINRVSQVAGAAGGLVLGGFLTTYGGWQAIFWVNVPIGIIGTVWSHYKLRELGTLDKNPKIDILGNITFAASLSALLIGISLYSLGSLQFSYFVLLIGSGIALLALFVLIERRVENPMLDLSLFKIRPFSGGTLATFVNSLARGCVLLVMTSYLQGPTMQLGPICRWTVLVAKFHNHLYFRPDKRMAVGQGRHAILHHARALGDFCRIPHSRTDWAKTTFLQFAVPMIFIGAGQGIFASPNRASVMSSVPPSHRGVASSVNSTMVQTGNSFSRAFSFLIMGFVIPGSVLQTIFSATSNLSSDPTFISEFVSSLHLLFYICAGLMLLSIIPSILRGTSQDRTKASEVLDDSTVA